MKHLSNSCQKLEDQVKKNCNKNKILIFDCI